MNPFMKKYVDYVLKKGFYGKKNLRYPIAVKNFSVARIVFNPNSIRKSIVPVIQSWVEDQLQLPVELVGKEWNKKELNIWGLPKREIRDQWKDEREMLIFDLCPDELPTVFLYTLWPRSVIISFDNGPWQEMYSQVVMRFQQKKDRKSIEQTLSQILVV